MPKIQNTKNIRFQDYQHLSNTDLVSLCLKNDREAWNEIFRRYDQEIEKAIYVTLQRLYRSDLSSNQDNMLDIKELVVVKLYSEGTLAGCNNPEGIKSWLWQISINKTIDWLNHRRTLSNIPKRFIEETISYLNAPINEKGDLSLIDTIEDYSGRDQWDEENERLKLNETILDNMKNLNSEKTLWALKLSLIAHVPFSEEDELALACFNGMPVEEVHAKLDEMKKYVDKKIENKDKTEAKAITLKYRIAKAEAMLKDIAGMESFSQKKAELEAKIEKYSIERKNCIARTKKGCRPSNKDIGLMVGLSADDVDQVTNILLRAREVLYRKYKSGK